MDKIRSHTKREPDLSAEKASMDRVCQFFNRDQALSPDYKSVLKNEGVDIVNWGDLKNDAKDRFTVIDHKIKSVIPEKNYMSMLCKMVTR